MTHNDRRSDEVTSQRDQQQRQAALRAIAQRGPSKASDARLKSEFDSLLPQERKKRPTVLVISVLIVLALLIAGVYGYQRRSANTPLAPIPQQLRINLMASKLYCPEEIAWSPNSLSLAVIAEAQDCQTDTGSIMQPDQALAVYSARTGALEKRVGITSTLAAANLTGSVATIGWSHDDASVYVICAIQSASGQAGAVALLVAPLASGRAQVYTSSLANYPSAGVIWNTPAKFSASALSQPLAPALTYTWSASSGSASVVPGESFPADLTRYTGTINQASGQSGFSFWQPGTVTPIISASATPGASPPPFALIFNTLTNQASPDGASFASGLSLYGRLQTPAGTGSAYNRALCTTGETKDACLSPVIPYADKALATVAAAVEQGVQIGGGSTLWYSASVAWRSDGAYLAALLPADGFDANGPQAQVTVYRASTGTVAARFTAARAMPSGSYDALGVSPVQWSPSGQQMALVDFASSTITAWDARSLEA